MHWYYVSSLHACLKPDDSFPHGLFFLLGPGRLLPCYCCHGLALKAAQGWNPISTLPFAFQQSLQSLALDSPPDPDSDLLMNSDDGDEWWWHSPLMSGTCQWSLEFLMKWIKFHKCTPDDPVKKMEQYLTSTLWQFRDRSIKLVNRHRISLEDETLSD